MRKGTTDGPGRDCTTRHPGAAARRRICLVMTGVARPAAGRPPPSQNSVLCAGTCAPLVMPCLRHLGQICTRSAYQNATHRRVSQRCPAKLLARHIVKQMRLFRVTIVREGARVPGEGCGQARDGVQAVTVQLQVHCCTTWPAAETGMAKPVHPSS